MRINFMAGITRGFTRKTVNLHVELVSDVSQVNSVLSSHSFSSFHRNLQMFLQFPGKPKLVKSLSLLLNNLVDNCIKKLRFVTTILVLEIIADYQHYSIKVSPSKR
jgi:hypothetical protein